MTIKICPSCGKSFVCQPENPAACQCAGIILSSEIRARIRARYVDCLCRDCLKKWADAPLAVK